MLILFIFVRSTRVMCTCTEQCMYTYYEGTKVAGRTFTRRNLGPIYKKYSLSLEGTDLQPETCKGSVSGEVAGISEALYRQYNSEPACHLLARFRATRWWHLRGSSPPGRNMVPALASRDARSRSPPLASRSALARYAGESVNCDSIQVAGLTFETYVWSHLTLIFRSARCPC